MSLQRWFSKVLERPIDVDEDNPLPSRRAFVASGIAAVHRTAVAAADLIATPGTVTCTKQAGGALAAGVYTIFVVAGNTLGRTLPKQGNATVTTETTNLRARAAFAQVVGAEYYDIYCSTDGAAAKYIGRVTEAERAAGARITALNTVVAGGAVNAVEIDAVGTGLAASAVVASTAIRPGLTAGFDATGYEKAALDITMTRTGDVAAPTLVIGVYYLNDRTSTWHQLGARQTITFGGAVGVYDGLKQRISLDVRGCSEVFVAVWDITGGTVDFEVTLT